MAVVRCFPSSPPLMIQKSLPIKNPLNKVLMVKHNSQMKKTLPLPLPQIRSSTKNKIFEDQSKGIVCYRDGSSGEITCEGYDEGPRLLHQQLSTISYNPRDAKIIDLLQKNWLQIVEGGADKGDDGLKGCCNWNDFNTLF